MTGGGAQPLALSLSFGVANAGAFAPAVTWLPISSRTQLARAVFLAVPVLFLLLLNHFSAALSAAALPPWLASPKNALAFGRQPLVVFR